MEDERQQAIAYLSTLVTEKKLQKIKKVLANRSRYITVVLEDVMQPHNASAIIRSADIFGVQDVHVIEEQQKFTPQNSIAKGATKWIDIYRYATTSSCINSLKQKGYRIIATTPHERGYSLHQLPLDKKAALVFGTEVTGLTEQALSAADEYVTIPMFGFTESFNLSVSVSLCLYHIMTALHQSSIAWQLHKVEQEEMQLLWLKKVLHIVKS